MNDIEKLLNKYFEGTSSLDEERALRQYFSGTQISPAHEPYKPLFTAFAEEKRVKAPSVNLSEVQNSTKKSLPMRGIVLVALSGIAAAFLLLLVLTPLINLSGENSYNVVIINGQKITDPLVAQEYAEKKFAEAQKLIAESYSPFHDAEKISREMDAQKIIESIENR